MERFVIGGILLFLSARVALTAREQRWKWQFLLPTMAGLAAIQVWWWWLGLLRPPLLSRTFGDL